MSERYRGKIDIPAILKSLEDAERFMQDPDPEKKKLGGSMKSFFQKLLARRQKELREAIERSAKRKR